MTHCTRVIWQHELGSNRSLLSHLDHKWYRVLRRTSEEYYWHFYQVQSDDQWISESGTAADRSFSMSHPVKNIPTSNRCKPASEYDPTAITPNHPPFLSGKAKQRSEETRDTLVLLELQHKTATAFHLQLPSSAYHISYFSFRNCFAFLFIVYCRFILYGIRGTWTKTSFHWLDRELGTVWKPLHSTLIRNTFTPK